MAHDLLGSVKSIDFHIAYCLILLTLLRKELPSLFTCTNRELVVAHDKLCLVC